MKLLPIVVSLAVLTGGLTAGPRFSALTSYAAPTNLVDAPKTIVAADFDGDGYMDIAVGGSTLAVMYGSSDWSPGRFDVVSSGTVTDLISADIDGDGLPDLVFAAPASSNPLQRSAGVYVQLSHGRAFTEPQQLSTSTGLLTSGDLNGDGRADLLIAGADLTVLVSNAAGQYSVRTLASAPFRASYGRPAIADFNADGKLDLAVVAPSDQSILMYAGTGDGSFRSPVSRKGACTSVIASDLNRDGWLDVLLFGGCAPQVLLGDGKGSFSTGPYFSDSNAFPDSAAIADVNGDCLPDFIGSYQNFNLIGIRYGKGDGRFETSQYRPVGPQPAGFAAADLDEDGRVDLAIVNSSGSVSLQLNTATLGGLSFRATVLPLATNYTSLTSGDFNGDGLPDLAVLGRLTIEVFLRRSDGTFASAGRTELVTVADRIIALDVNRDGR